MRTINEQEYKKRHERVRAEVMESAMNRDKYPWPRLLSDYKWNKKRQTFIYSVRKPTIIIQYLLSRPKK